MSATAVAPSPRKWMTPGQIKKMTDGIRPLITAGVKEHVGREEAQDLMEIFGPAVHSHLATACIFNMKELLQKWCNCLVYTVETNKPLTLAAALDPDRRFVHQVDPAALQAAPVLPPGKRRFIVFPVGRFVEPENIEKALNERWLVGDPVGQYFLNSLNPEVPTHHPNVTMFRGKRGPRYTQRFFRADNGRRFLVADAKVDLERFEWWAVGRPKWMD